MNIYDWITRTFLYINDDFGIEFAVVNDEIVDLTDGSSIGFKRYEFSSFNHAVEWARRNSERYVIDDMHMISIGSYSGVTIYIKDVNKE